MHSGYTEGSYRRRTLKNGLGATPAMGWSSWTANGENVTEQNIRNAGELHLKPALHQTRVTAEMKH
jgi:hypothetical protein